jgi:hypothetical protein
MFDHYTSLLNQPYPIVAHLEHVIDNKLQNYIRPELITITTTEYHCHHYHNQSPGLSPPEFQVRLKDIQTARRRSSWN